MGRHHDEADSRDPSAQRRQEALWEEVKRLRLLIDHREQQKAFQRAPQSKDTHYGDSLEEDEGHDSSTRGPADRRGVFSRSPVRVVLALIVAALLCAGGMHFWNYLQSYEWTDDAEIDGHLDLISTRANDTVIHVYVENTYHVKAGQVLVDLDPRDYQVTVENAEANLAKAEQGVEAARQNYNLSIANFDSATATNVKAQLDVKRYGELFNQAVIARETDDEIDTTGKGES
jgi:membrane fusion protein, multidrug efflux system